MLYRWRIYLARGCIVSGAIHLHLFFHGRHSDEGVDAEWLLAQSREPGLRPCCRISRPRACVPTPESNRSCPSTCRGESGLPRGKLFENRVTRHGCIATPQTSLELDVTRTTRVLGVPRDVGPVVWHYALAAAVAPRRPCRVPAVDGVSDGRHLHVANIANCNTSAVRSAVLPICHELAWLAFQKYFTGLPVPV